MLIHGGAGGVGTAAIQLAKRAGCRVLVTAGSKEKMQRSIELGADVAINHRTEDFVDRTLQETDGGADVILDVMGAAYLDRNIRALGYDGRLVIIGMQGGSAAELDIAALNRKRGTVMATNLRHRPHQQKAEIVARFAADVLPAIADGSVRPIVDRVFPLEQAADAHRALESGGIIGKVILQVHDGA